MTKKIIFTPTEKDKIIRSYKNGARLHSIADKVGVSRATISIFLDEHNIKKRSRSQSHSMYFCNEEYFSKIDTEEKAYWLGFISADGFINSKSERWGVTLSADDKNHLEKLKESLDSTHPVNIFAVNKEKGYYSSRLHICSKQMKNDLISNGVLENKTEYMKFPSEEQVPQSLIRHYMRGYFDGDGSVYLDNLNRWYLNLLGTKEFLIDFKEKMGYPDYKIYKDKRSIVYYITIGAQKTVLDILDFLYKDSTIYLDRKYLRYKEAKLSL